jgi:excisionase family DNA binding protein
MGLGHGYCAPGKGCGSQFKEKERAMKAPAVDGEVLTAKEVCALLQIHPSTLYKLTKQGRIPSFRIGNDWRFRMDLIERWMDEKSIYARLARNVIESGVN